jgi:hypothetical protein
MRKSDLIGWDWKCERGQMVVYPTAEAYGKYVLYLLVGPVLILISLTIAGVTPWGILRHKTARTPSKPLMDEAQQEELEQSRQRMIDGFREVLDEKGIERLQAQAALEAEKRALQWQVAERRISLVGLGIASLLGLLWLLMIGLGSMCLAALIRLPTATYRISRTKSGDLLFQIPHLFRTIEYHIPAVAIKDCIINIGNYSKWGGKYGLRVLIWFVALKPKHGQPFELPLFVIADQFHKDSTGRPPARVIEFSEALRRMSFKIDGENT